MYKEVTATKKIKNLNKRLRFVQGGTSASKTVSIILYLIALAQTDQSPTLTSIISESMPHLKRGSRKDFLDILQTHNYYKDNNWNATDNIYTFETGSKIEFFSADQPGKVRGPRRDRLFINEGNNIPFETYEQLEIRTKEFVVVDWNPVTEFWFHEYIEGMMDYEFIKLNYTHNEALDDRVKQSIEARKHRANWWRVYGLGELGELEDKIYKDWQLIDKIPHEARLEVRGLDFGYTVDPTAIVDIYYYNGGYILDEQLYQTGMSNKRISDFIKDLPQATVIADSAEPKSIDEIYSYGVNIRGAEKGKDSVRQGISLVQEKPISVTKRSVNLIKEYRNYSWARDRVGELVKPNEPEKSFNHCMDAIRYGICSMMRRDPIQEIMKERMRGYEQREKAQSAIKEYGL